MQIQTILLCFTATTLFSCSQSSVSVEPERSERLRLLDTLATWMTGSFSSMEQASNDTNYYYIGLKMCQLERSDSSYSIYVEQALGGTPDKPYRQRVYVISPSGAANEYKSEIFTIESDSLFTGACSDSLRKAGILNAPLASRIGCDVVLRWNGTDAFEGGTIGSACQSNLRGAAYATTSVRVLRAGLESWDQGFDSTGLQVWGPENGPYVFLRE